MSLAVTMKMGIERVLREKFSVTLREMVQFNPGAAPGEGRKAASLTMEAVWAEINKTSQAITAMGGVGADIGGGSGVQGGNN